MVAPRPRGAPSRRGGAGTDVGGEDFTAAWTRALDELEVEVERAEALLSAEHARAGAARAGAVGNPTRHGGPGWVPPQLRSPLPDTLRERAERLLERQLAVSGRLSAAMTSSRRHLDVVDRLVPGDPRPMYVDQAL